MEHDDMQEITTGDGLILVEFHLRDYLEGGILREHSFTSAMNSIEWSAYTGKHVLVKACGSDPLPPWSFMLVTARLIHFAASIYYGDSSDPFLIYRREER
ncbi:DUF2480 family protein [candidate division KSB1 bacterium]